MTRHSTQYRAKIHHLPTSQFDPILVATLGRLKVNKAIKKFINYLKLMKLFVFVKICEFQINNIKITIFDQFCGLCKLLDQWLVQGWQKSLLRLCKKFFMSLQTKYSFKNWTSTTSTNNWVTPRSSVLKWASVTAVSCRFYKKKKYLCCRKKSFFFVSKQNLIF